MRTPFLLLLNKKKTTKTFVDKFSNLIERFQRVSVYWETYGEKLGTYLNLYLHRVCVCVCVSDPF